MNISLLLDELNLFNLPARTKKRVLISNIENKIDFNTVEKLRDRFIVEYYYNESDDLKKQLKYANKLSFDYILINNEVKDLNTGVQVDVADFLKSI